MRSESGMMERKPDPAILAFRQGPSPVEQLWAELSSEEGELDCRQASSNDLTLFAVEGYPPLPHLPPTFNSSHPYLSTNSRHRCLQVSNR